MRDKVHSHPTVHGMTCDAQVTMQQQLSMIGYTLPLRRQVLARPLLAFTVLSSSMHFIVVSSSSFPLQQPPLHFALLLHRCSLLFLCFLFAQVVCQIVKAFRLGLLDAASQCCVPSLRPDFG